MIHPVKQVKFSVAKIAIVVHNFIIINKYINNGYLSQAIFDCSESNDYCYC